MEEKMPYSASQAKKGFGHIRTVPEIMNKKERLRSLFTFLLPDVNKKPPKKVNAAQKEHTHFLEFILTVIAFLFFLEAARELLGATYNMNLATFSINSSVIAVFAFFSPFVHLLGLGRFQVRTLTAGSGVILACSRVFMAVDPAVGIYLLCTVLAVVSFGVFLPALITQFKQGTETGAAPLQLMIAGVLGAGADVVFRTLGDTFDVSVYGFTAQRLTALVVVLPLAVCFLGSLVLWYHTVKEEHAGQRTGALCSRGLRALLSCSVGATGFLYLALLGYPNNVARWVDGPYALAAIGMGTALGGFVVASLSRVRKWLTSERGLTLGSVVIFLAFAFIVFFPVPVVTIILLVCALFFLPAQFIFVTAYLMQPGVTTKQVATFLGAAAVVMVLLLLFSVFSLTWAFLPGMGFLRDQIGTIILVAVILFFAGLTVARYRSHLSADGMLTEGSRTLAQILSVIVIVGTISGALLYPAPAPQPGKELVVMTYNIHQGYDVAGKINPWEILEPIQRVNPDVLALIESDMNRVSSANVDIVQWLAHKLNMYVYFGPETSKQIYGVAILSKYPLTNTETYYLTSRKDQRVLIRGDIHVAGNSLSIYAVHVGLSEEDRTNQTAEILGILQKNANAKILMGDFNSLPDSKQIQDFTNVLSDTWVSCGHSLTDPLGYTVDSWAPHERIDYIFVSQELTSYVETCEVIREVYGSDHLPVWATLTM